MALNILILVMLTSAALWIVMTRSLLRAAIGLTLASVILTVLMFRLNAALAAAFELSVCAGLIPVLFVSTISLTHPLSRQEIVKHMKDRLRRFGYLPFVIIAAGVALSVIKVKFNFVLPNPQVEQDARLALWNMNPLYLAGQIIILVAGALGVVVLFKEPRE